MSYLPNLIKDKKLTNLTMKNTQQMFPAAAVAAVKLLNYKNIAPAPQPPASTMKNLEFKNIAPAQTSLASEVLKNRKYTPRAANNNNNIAANIDHRNSSSNGIGVGIAPYSIGGDQTQSVQRRNARERNRVKQVNNSFARLRQHLPKEIVTELTKGGGRGPQKKISKVDTLRIAVEYIRRLEDYVEDLSGGGGDLCLSGATSKSTTPTGAILQQFNNNNLTQQQQQVTQDFMQQNLQQQQQQHFQSSQHLQQQQYQSSLLTPVTLAAFSPMQMTKVDISCHSPTASYISNNSFDSGTYEPAQQLSPEPATFAGESVTGAGVVVVGSHPSNLALKFEPYDDFRLDEEDCTPDDDEIIDYISLWQEEQQATQN